VLFEATGAEWAAEPFSRRRRRGPPSAVVADRARARDADANQTTQPSDKRTASPGSKKRRSTSKRARSTAGTQSSKEKTSWRRFPRPAPTQAAGPIPSRRPVLGAWADCSRCPS